MAKLLLLGSSPVNLARTRLDAEVREIQTQLTSAKHRNAFVPDARFAVRLEELIGIFQDSQPNIVYFGGHCDETGLQFEDNSGLARPISSANLTRIFKLPYVRNNVRCVVLNACETESLATALVDCVDAAIGTKRKISNQTAKLFAGGFYLALANGLTVEEATESGATHASLMGGDGDAYVAAFRTDEARKITFVSQGGGIDKSSWRRILSGSPSRPEIRKALSVFLKTDADFDWFVMDYFPAIHTRFSAGMERTLKENLLIQVADASDLIAALLQRC